VITHKIIQDASA